MKKAALIILAMVIGIAAASDAAEAAPRVLPGELTAEQILNGEYPFPASPAVTAGEDGSGFASNRVTRVPPPGVHPRILFSPGDIPDIRHRINQTDTGRKLIANLRDRVAASIMKQGIWENDVFEKLAAGDARAALKILDSNPKPNSKPGHYQPYILYALVMEAFDALIFDDAARGKKVAAAIATYARMISPLVDEQLKQPLADDVWRVKVSGPTTGDWSSNQGMRDLVGYHNLGYAYDFAAPFMTEPQRADVRSVIARVTAGRVWMGAHLPHHFRNWNWVAVGLSQPLLALAIEGEPGYDPRVCRLGVEIARDYFAYGITENGFSTEAVGYTQFGLVWANPFLVAAARRGDNLLVQNHHRAMIDWYLQCMQPFASGAAPDTVMADEEQRQRSLPHTWVSHGDGGDEGPAVWTMAMWKYFYPADPKVDFLWQNVIRAHGRDMLRERIHLIEPLLWATDGRKDDRGRPVDYAGGRMLGLPLTCFDPVRSSLITRSQWSPDALVFQFECRTDSVGASHEHADRGNFTLSALGRSWAKENFRSVETRHHNNILIDGRGQGYWPGPGRWLGLEETGGVLVAACDAKDAYDWMWPKEIHTEPPDFERFKYPRWSDYAAQAQVFQKNHAGVPHERDSRPAVVAHWQGFERGDPRMWDEDGWPVRFRFNPVQRAFRTVAVVRGESPYVLVVDDIQKDETEHLYEWLMQTGPDTEVAAITGNDMILCDATVKRDAAGVVRPAKGDRALLVRILDLKDPAQARDYQTRPSFRLETFERRDTLLPEAGRGDLSGSRSFGRDKRLVIASRSVAPDFKILLFPHRVGAPLPVTRWNEERTRLTIDCGGRTETFKLARDPAGRTQITVVP